MASKSKKRSKGRKTVDPVGSLKRNLERGEYKQALKDARVCYRRSPTAEHRCFLEHACMGRAQQLARNGLIDESQRVARELLDLGVTEPSVQAGLPDLLLSIGMLDALPQNQDTLSDVDRNRLRLKAADQAVINPERIPASMKELRGEAELVRKALEAVERQDDSAASTHLRGISRRSVFADWKIFVRGLIAYYRQATAEMEENWSRLDPDRTAATIAAPLRVMAGTPDSGQHGNLRPKISRLEQQAGGEAVLSSLARLRQSAATHDWTQFFKTLRIAHASLRQAGDDFYRRGVSHFTALFVRGGLVDQLARFTKIVEAPPTDPRWNRTWALAYENTEYYEDDPNKYWKLYLTDLADLPALPAEQRNLARSMVWLHLAEDYADDAGHLRECRCGADHTRDIEIVEKEALSAFEQCQLLAPTYVPGYRVAAEFHVDAGRLKEAVAVYERLLEHVPEELDALVWLAEHHIESGVAARACEYAGRARQLKPLDSKTGELLWSAQMELARELAQADRFVEAREAVAAADRILPEEACGTKTLAQKAALETKAGDAGAARRLVEQAQDKLEEPTVLWLMLTIESLRYGLPKQEVWLYENRWLKALKRRCRSATAGSMCRTLLVQTVVSQIPAEIENLCAELLPYVRRCTRVKWEPGDLRDVCRFLVERREWGVLWKLAAKGVRKFPDVAYFHFLQGMEEISKGPFCFNRRRAIDRFERTIELASGSSDSRDQWLLEEAQRMIDQVNSAPAPGPFERVKESEEGGLSGENVRKTVERICRELGIDPEKGLVELGDLVEIGDAE